MWRLWRLSVRQMTSRLGRTILTLVSVVIGVAAVVAVTLSSGTTRQVYKGISEALSGRADFEIVGPGNAAFDQRIAQKVSSVPGVEAVVPQLQRWAIVYFGEHRAKAGVMGIDVINDRKIREFKVVEGAYLTEAEQTSDVVMLESTFARSVNAKVGDDIRLLRGKGLLAGMVHLKVVALITPVEVTAVTSGMTLFLPLPAAQRIFSSVGKVDSLQVVAEPKADRQTVKQAIIARLPSQLSVQNPSSRSQLAEQSLESAQEALRLAGALSLVLSIFIILNTFLMSVTERRSQLAVLRAVGTTRRQLLHMMLMEGVLLGAVGSVLGTIAGIGGAFLLTRAIEQFMDTPLPAVEVPVVPLLLASVLGISLSLLAAFVPALRASQVSPLEGLGVSHEEDLRYLPRRLALLGLGICVACGSLLAAAMLKWLNIQFAVPSGAGVLVGFVLMVPAGLKPMSRMAAWLPSFVMPAETNLARGQLIAHPVRAMLTIGVLFIALAPCVMLGTTILNNIQDIQRWIARTVGTADFFVRAMMPDMATGEAADMPASVGEELRAMPEIAHLYTARRVSTQIGDQSVLMIARNFGPDELPLDIKVGNDDDVRARLAKGEIVLGSMLAQRLHKTVGDTVDLIATDGPRPFRIAGIANEYTAGGLTVFIQGDVAREQLGVSGVDNYIIKAHRGQNAALEEKLRKFADDHGLILQSAAVLKQTVDSMVAGVVGCLWGLLSLAIVVAAFGIVNTLTMNVLEQTRELALLRVVAMTRRQIRRTILCQAAILGAIGLIPGAIVGAGLAYLMHIGTVREFGHAAAYAAHPAFVFGLLAMAYGVVVAAAMLPAERAARLNLLTALHYE
jgi:putative ABC transport system permease protein